MQRVEGWEKKLNARIENHLVLKQVWGEVDCCMFPCDWIIEATGSADPAKDFRGRYKTKIGANRAIKEFAGDLMGVAERITLELAMEEIMPLKARRGDLAIVPGNGGDALGVVDMTGRMVAVQGKDGLKFVQINNALKTWRVG